MKMHRFIHGDIALWRINFRITELTIILLFVSLVSISTPVYSENDRLNLTIKEFKTVDLDIPVKEKGEADPTQIMQENRKITGKVTDYSGGSLPSEGNKGGNIMINPNISRNFDENKDYFYPIPISERLLNPNLTQNTDWNDGL